MQLPQPDPTDTGETEMISFDVRNQAFCVEIASVQEIRGWAPATPISQAPDYMCGVINLRGSVLPILDLAAKLEFGHSTPTARHAIVVVQVGAHTLGLLVDGVNEIISVRAGEVQPVPDLGGLGPSEYIGGVLPINDRMITLLRLERLIDAEAALVA